jgi:hypothetical protein
MDELAESANFSISKYFVLKLLLSQMLNIPPTAKR